MFYKLAVSLSLFGLACSQLQAQFPPEISFCPAGVHADGYIDWTKLPPGVANTATTATIPVTGIPGLTATITFPATQGYPTSAYSVQNSSNLLLPAGVNPTITFSSPVQGVSATFQTSGRFGHTFTMTAYSSATGQIGAPGPVPAQVTADGSDRNLQLYSTTPLQIRSTSANLSAVTLAAELSLEEYFTYRLINLRIESGSSDPATQVPTNGLKEWLRGDRSISGEYYAPINAGSLASWPDQSGNGSDAVAVSDSSVPYVFPDGPNCTPVVVFDAAQQTQLNFNLPINGWTEMTVFLAGQAYADVPGWYQNQALLWNETALWGTTFFTPAQTSVFFRFGTTQVNNQPIYSRPVIIGGDFSVTTAVHNSTTDSLYVNGLLALQQTGKFAAISGTTSNVSIGAGLNNTFFTGNIGEILIYNRALSNKERSIVEHYLLTKYGVQ